MPPVRVVNKKPFDSLNSGVTLGKPITRSCRGLTINGTLKKENLKDVCVFTKRKAVSPIKGNTIKRSALGNITNAIETKCVISSGKKAVKKITSSNITRPTISTSAKTTLTLPIAKLPTTTLHKISPKKSMPKPLLPPLPKSRLKPVVPLALLPSKEKVGKPITAKSPTIQKKTVQVNKCRITVKPKGTVCHVPSTRRSSGRRSTLDSSESSLYVSALSDVLDDVPSIEQVLPKPLINIDEEYINDPHQCATYAYEIFEYLKIREERFKIKNYMASQPGLSPNMRAILVDWMVDIQENFEFNHETLYLGVKLVDAYLSKVRVSKANLQLVGATAMLISAKYDERAPPSIEDFVYICNEAYDKQSIIKMELDLLRVIDFELGFPLSYRFLRRYARCAKISMPLLTLARFILEFTLMDYCTVTLSDSKLAAAALYLAIKMKEEQEWDDTLIYFTGYKVEDFIAIVHILNDSLHQKPRQTLSTVRNKYSHKLFHEVAKVPLVSNEQL